MHLGEQLQAPYGFEALRAGVIYHFLYSAGVDSQALLLTFGAPVSRDAAAPVPRPGLATKPQLIRLRRDRFEESIRSGLLRPVEKPRTLPHWLGDVSIQDLLLHDQRDDKRRHPHSERIDTMLAHLWSALQQVPEILASANPAAALNRLARGCLPPQNECKFRTAFFAYLCFSRERLALHYPISNLGKWDRTNRDKKFGRPSILGAWHGHSSCSQAIQEMCLQGFRDYAGPGQDMRSIYRKTMLRIFGCRPEKDLRQRMSFVHPEGRPFPTYGQFRYRVGQVFDLETRQLLKFGSARVRTKLAPSLGKFTDATANAMEILQEDAYSIEEVVMGYLPGSHLPRIYVVRILCVSTGMVVGIGFSMKGEKAEAYRMAKFCMAVDKVWFCSLFGIVITHDEWPSVGLPLHQVDDRGPGATVGADASDSRLRPMIKELVPSYSGQSKANIETRHPKTVKLEGAPYRKVTRQSVVQLVRREIWKAIESNKSTNALPRLGPCALRDRVLATPVGLWKYLVELGRTFSYEVPRYQAIRGHLVKVDVTVRDGAVFFEGFRYWSAQLRDSGLLAMCSIQVHAYLLPMCVRHLFLDTPSGILTVDWADGIRSGGDEFWLSLAEIDQLKELRAEELAEFVIHREAAKADVAMRFEEETGMAFDQSELRPGRAKRGNAASLDEARQIMPLLRAAGGKK